MRNAQDLDRLAVVRSLGKRTLNSLRHIGAFAFRDTISLEHGIGDLSRHAAIASLDGIHDLSVHLVAPWWLVATFNYSQYIGCFANVKGWKVNSTLKIRR
jgi:uncharacterized membrane protein (GlpM family)